MAMFDKPKGNKQTTPDVPEPRVTQPPPSISPAPAAAPGTDKATMIGRGISIAGDVTADTHLKVEGVIEGRVIESSHDVEIGESAKVIASITAKVVRIAGEVTGDINGSEKVLISKSGRVQGNVTAPRVQLEDGALFRGSIDMNPAKPAAAKPVPAETTQASNRSGATESGTRKEPGLSLQSG